MFKILQRLARSLIVLTVTLASVFCLGIAWYVYGIHSEARAVPTSLAFWLQHDFSTVAATSTDVAQLQERIQTHAISELYFHVGPLSESGQLATDLSIPTELLATLPTTNYAWIGQIRSQINLDDPVVRSAIITSAGWALTQGFDGIHLNIEPVRKDDSAFIQLVQELRTAFPQTKISLAMDEWQPAWLSNWLARSFDVSIESYWPTSLVEALAPYVDEFVVMTYDTNFHDPKLYEWWVEQQTIALSQIVPKNVMVRIGIPAYKKGLALDPKAENLSTGLAGFTRGVQNLRSDPSRLAGLAVYPYWEMDSTDWQTLSTFLGPLTPNP